MDTQDVSMARSSLVKDFDETISRRAEKHEYLRGRNNVTSCRSPTREFDTNVIKSELQYKRQLEFQKRRPVSPDPGMRAQYRPPKKKSSAKQFSVKPHSPETQSKTWNSNIQMTPSSNGRPLMVKLTQSNGKVYSDQSSSKFALPWSEPVTSARQDKILTRKQEAAPISAIYSIKKPTQKRMKVPEERQNIINAQKTSTRTSTQTENILHSRQFSIQTKTTRQDSSAQIEPGFIAVKEADVQQLTDYLQEALWREEALKKKLAVLQDRASILLNASNNIWTARCNEDLLRIKIKALEAQLQVCLQKFPKDGVKKLALQMEKQKLLYEEKAVSALQKAMQEKTEALTNADILQEALQVSKAESERWQHLYEELKQSTAHLQKSQELSIGQLHSQLELSRGREVELQDEMGSLQQENEELWYNLSVLEVDNRNLREEMESLRDCSTERQNFLEEQLRLKEASQVEEQLQRTQDKLQQKENECAELQKELGAMEQECQSSQARLTQCREELRLLSHHRRSSSSGGSWGLCGSWRWLCMFLFPLLVIAVGLMLCMWHPPFRDQVEDIYSDIQTRIDNYLMEMDFSQASGCFKPI